MERDPTEEFNQIGVLFHLRRCLEAGIPGAASLSLIHVLAPSDAPPGHSQNVSSSGSLPGIIGCSTSGHHSRQEGEEARNKEDRAVLIATSKTFPRNLPQIPSSVSSASTGSCGSTPKEGWTCGVLAEQIATVNKMMAVF